MARVDREALLAAARILADEVKRQAGFVSQRTVDATNINEVADGVEVRAGRPGGKWGWEPITAWMFQTGAKHPLYGDRSHWYRQRHWPFLDLAIQIAGDRAASEYADKEIDRLLRGL